MPKLLTPTRFGNPVLRQQAEKLTPEQINSTEIQSLISDMKYTLEKESYGVGIAAPQVGHSVALSVIGIKPTPTRPELEPFTAVIINPEIIKTYGQPVPKWESCISSGEADNLLYAMVPRYDKIKLSWLDETGQANQEVLDGFVAHVAQHEVNHLSGILFVDKVTDTTTYMLADEYRARVVKATKTSY